MQMLCRNKLADYAKWKRGFDSHTQDHKNAGLELMQHWRNVDNPDEVFFLFDVANKREAIAFVNAPSAAEMGKKYGVIEGDYWLVM